MLDRIQIAKNWLPRYTGMPLAKFGDYILLTNFSYYIKRFAEKFNCYIYGENKFMQAASNDSGLIIINFGIGSANTATIMDLLVAIKLKGGLFLGKYGGLKESIFIVGHHNEISRGALPLVSDVPITPEGVKTEESNDQVIRRWSNVHLELGIEVMTEIGDQGEHVKHFRY